MSQRQQSVILQEDTGQERHSWPVQSQAKLAVLTQSPPSAATAYCAIRYSAVEGTNRVYDPGTSGLS
ncbi:MAG: hypothetical protein ACE5LU_27265, partial [Anaerolineae bacterium]